jgi:hypothetical protein
MAPYPVRFNVSRPHRFERRNIFLRLLLVALVWLLVTTPLVILTHIALPLLAATVIAGKDGRRYVEEDSRWLVVAIRWYLALYSYTSFLVDRFPSDALEGPIDLTVTPGGTPTTLSALSRIVLSLPSALVLAALGLAGAVVWIIAVISVLLTGNYPPRLYGYQRGVMRWHARLLAYHASLVHKYPPFSFDTGYDPVVETGEASVHPAGPNSDA